MARFLIEVSHDAEQVACARAVEAFFKTGSHFFTHADWGCFDGEHKGWIIVEVDSRNEAQAIVPPIFRTRAKIVQLNAFSQEQLDEIIRSHKP
jgi:hypothetical protein